MIELAELREAAETQAAEYGHALKWRAAWQGEDMQTQGADCDCGAGAHVNTNPHAPTPVVNTWGIKDNICPVHEPEAHRLDNLRAC